MANREAYGHNDEAARRAQEARDAADAERALHAEGVALRAAEEARRASGGC
jgi:hypothetical protein